MKNNNTVSYGKIFNSYGLLSLQLLVSINSLLTPNLKPVQYDYFESEPEQYQEEIYLLKTTNSTSKVAE